jgi:hypothetical protein
MNSRDVIIGAGAGAALAYILDPTGGGRRRALVRDKVGRATRKTRDGFEATARDIRNRTQGIAAATQGRWSREDADDDTLRERVRAKLGRVCSHPRAIDVEVVDGSVTLCGPILADEIEDVLVAASSVRGVQSVTNDLDVHQFASGVPSLQGEGRVAGASLDILQPNWAPATQALVAAAALTTGVLFAAYARR